MINILKKIASKIGLNKTIMFTSSAYIIGAVGSVISIILVVKYLTGVEQGFYYTFGSIVAIQVFFELGLNGIITQYAAHETSSLIWETEYRLSGESKYLSRLSSLLHFSIKWYLSFALILIFTLIIVGLIFFNRYESPDSNVEWVIPWIILAVGTGLNLILSPLVAFIQGIGKVKEMAQIQLWQQILKLTIICSGLILGSKLYVMGLSSLLGAALVILILAVRYRNILSGIWNIVIVEKVHYRKEIFPYQWKIAMSWISGYFIFQLFNPVLFASEGPVIAGQMGMTLAALNGILALSLAWISTKVPLFSGLIARQEYSKLDDIFKQTLKQSAFINFSALTFFLGAIFVIRYFNLLINGNPLGNRFLNYLPMLFMMVPVFLNQFVGAWATYLRCHKKEPFLINSITGGVLCSLSTILLGKYFGVYGVTVGYLSISVLLFPWAYHIFRTKKQEWHG